MALLFRTVVAIAAATMAVTATGVTQTAGQTSGAPEGFNAFALSVGNFGPTQSGTIEMVVTR